MAYFKLINKFTDSPGSGKNSSVYASSPHCSVSHSTGTKLALPLHWWNWSTDLTQVPPFFTCIHLCVSFHAILSYV